MTITIDPSALGVSLLPWTTLLTMLGAAGAIAWMVRRAALFGLTGRAAYGVALRTVLWALLGGRVLHVLGHGDFYAEVPFQAFYLWNGGQSLWGALIFGAGGAIWHAKRAGAVLPAFGDALALAGLATIAVGRLGDLLAGERLGTGTSLPWAITYAHEGSASFGAGATHPVAFYEILLVGAILALLVSRRVPAKPGWAIDLAFVGYAVGRFLIGFATVERTVWWLDVSQWVALAIIAVVAWYARSRMLGRHSQEQQTGEMK
jgi:prolipoprotein diacylglyceryltransferase